MKPKHLLCPPQIQLAELLMDETLESSFKTQTLYDKSGRRWMDERVDAEKVR